MKTKNNHLFLVSLLSNYLFSYVALILVIILSAILFIPFTVSYSDVLPIDEYVADSRNLIRDPSFELGGSDWTQSQYGKPWGFSYSIVQSQAHSGNNSLRVDFDGTTSEPPDQRHNFYHVYQAVSVQASNKYKFTYWAKTQDMTLPVGVQFDLLDVNKNPINESGSYPGIRVFSLTPDGTNEWARYSGVISTTSDTAYVKIRLRVVGKSGVSGTAWWDDIALKPIPKVTNATITQVDDNNTSITLEGNNFGTDPIDRVSALNNIKIHDSISSEAVVDTTQILSWNNTSVIMQLSKSIAEVSNLGFKVTAGGEPSRTFWKNNLQTLSNNTLELEFNKAKDFSINQIRNRQSGREFVPALPTDIPLYKIGYKNTPLTSNIREVTNLEADDIFFSTSSIGQPQLTIKFIHENLGLTVNATVLLDNDFARWRISIDNNRKQIIQYVVYPYMLYKPMLGNQAGDDKVLMPLHEGTIHKNINALENGTSSIYEYPGDLNMQFMSYYDDEKVNQAPAGGLFMATFDTQGNKKKIGYKRLGMTSSYLNDAMEIDFKHVISEEPGNDFNMNYDFVLAAFTGDWYDAADIYKDWALKQWWASTQTADRADIPKKIADSDSMVVTYNTEISDWSSFMDYYVKALSAEPNAIDINNLIFNPGGYWGIRDSGYMPNWSGIDYFQPLPDGTIPLDPQAGDPLTNSIQQLKGNKTSSYLFMEGNQIWDIYEKDGQGAYLFDDSNDFNAQGSSQVVIKQNGEPDISEKQLTNAWDPKIAPGVTYTRKSAQICIGSETNNIIDAVIVENIERGARRGTELMSLDGLVGGRIPGSWDSNHGHPVGEGKWTHQRLTQLFQRINERITSIGKKGQFALSMENQAELYIPWLQLQYGRHGFYSTPKSRAPKYKKIALFNYVYHGRYLGIDNAQGQNNVTGYGPLNGKWSLGMSFIEVNIPGFIAPAQGVMPANLNFYKKLLKNTDKSLRYAEVMHPPTISGLPQEQYYSFTDSSKSYEFYYNPLLYNAFKTTDGKIHYLFVNLEDVSAPTSSLSFELSAYNLVGTKFDVYKIINGNKELLYDDKALPNQVEFNINGEDIVQFVVEPVDTTPPTVSINYPNNGSTVNGITNISANANDDKGISKVEFYIDGQYKDADNTSPYEYSFDTTSVDDGFHNIKVRAVDNSGNSGESSIDVIVYNNHAPTLDAVGNKEIDEGSLLSFDLSATDTDGDSLTYTALNLPIGATLVANVFNWTPDYSQAGIYDVTFQVSDGQLSDSKTITITVNNTDVTPPSAFDLVSPANESRTNNNPIFSWQASSDSESGLAKYELYIDGVLNITVDAQTTSTLAASALSVGTHTWFVKAYDNTGNVTQSSSVFSLNTKRVGKKKQSLLIKKALKTKKNSKQKKTKKRSRKRAKKDKKRSQR